MKLRIFEEKEKESKKEKEVYLKLKKTSFGDINLIACDESGYKIVSGFILGIQSDGTLRRYSSLNKIFQLDSNDRIKLVE